MGGRIFHLLGAPDWTEGGPCPDRNQVLNLAESADKTFGFDRLVVGKSSVESFTGGGR
jgi:hypothetical protein